MSLLARKLDMIEALPDTFSTFVNGGHRMLQMLNNYAGLFNFVLFATIVGLLVHLTNMYRTALVDKYEAQMETLRQQFTLIQLQESAAMRSHEAAVKLLERQVTFYKSMADMPEDRRVVAIKLEYQQRLAELELELSSRTAVEEKLKAEVTRIHAAAEEVSKDPSPTLSTAIAVLEQVFKMTRLLH